MILILLMACEPLPTTVALSGTVLDAPDGEGSPVAGASVVTFDDALETVGEAVTDASGAFEVDVPAGYAFFLHVDADARVPTAFSGTAGLTDFGAGDGYPWSADQAWVDAQRADFAGCGTAGDTGAIVAGEARVPLAGGASTPLVPDVTVEAIGADGVTRVACYLPVDDAGTAGVETGETLETLIARIASPGGTTRAGLDAMAAGGDLERAAAAAVRAAVQRARSF
jgi:hypothetical protein